MKNKMKIPISPIKQYEILESNRSRNYDYVYDLDENG